MGALGIPHPPYELGSRVGSLDHADDPWGLYEWIGAATKREVEAALPDGVTFAGRRVLDFGCGAGRTLRHFLAADVAAELWGCDIDDPSIAWLEQHLSPRLRVFVNGERPPLPQPDEFFDVIYCASVFSHLTSTWSDWLLELHRVLKPEGVLVVSFMGEGQSDAIAGEPWDEDRVGMLILRPAQSWDLGGPMVLHSPWWIRGHWGRLFEVANLRPHGFAAAPGTGHGLVTLVKKSVLLTAEDLRAPSDDPREAIALAHNVDLLCRELERNPSPANWLRHRPARTRAAEVSALGGRLPRAARLVGELSGFAQRVSAVRRSRP